MYSKSIIWDCAKLFFLQKPKVVLYMDSIPKEENICLINSLKVKLEYKENLKMYMKARLPYTYIYTLQIKVLYATTLKISGNG